MQVHVSTLRMPYSAPLCMHETPKGSKDGFYMFRDNGVVQYGMVPYHTTHERPHEISARRTKRKYNKFAIVTTA